MTHFGFEIKARDGAARLGRFKTRHGTVTTPTLLPVINPNLAYVPAGTMRKYGAEMLITNAYITWKKPELKERALKEGIHKLIGWDGPLMTDSGTFQMYVYGDVEIQPEEVVAFERDVGVDVGTILDVFSTPERTHGEAEADYKETVRRAAEAAKIKGDLALAATVQGSVYPDLRRKCAEAYLDLDVDFFPIGGVVPLMERQRYRDLVHVVVAAKQGLDPAKPVHLFGAGHPQMFAMAALMGCDFFDSSSYAKFAKDGRMMFEDGTRHLADLTDVPCACPVCSTHTAHELRSLPEEERALRLGEHNLYVSFQEIRRVREAIRHGSLWELVEQRARTHPSLLDALKALVSHGEWIETLEPLSKARAFRYGGPESVHRSEPRRWRARMLDRFDPRGRDVVLLPPAAKPYSMTYAALGARFRGKPFTPAAYSSVLGIVPFALDEAYPAAQSVEPDSPDAEAVDAIHSFIEAFSKEHGVRVVSWDEAKDEVDASPAGEAEDPDLERVRNVADYQFGPGAGEALTAGGFRVKKSRNTGKIRTVTVDGEHVLSLRAEDGFFTLKRAGARRLHGALPAPRLRVVVAPDSVPFNREGKSAFAKFVLNVDPALRPGDECLVVDEADDLVAVGQLVLAAREVAFFRTGVAVDVREGVKPGADPGSALR